MENYLKEIQDLRNGIRNLQAQIAMMAQTIDALESKLTIKNAAAQVPTKKISAYSSDESFSSNRPLQQQINPSSFANRTSPSERNQSASQGGLHFQRNRIQIRTPQPQSSEQPVISCNVIAEFNALANQKGLASKDARDEFVQRYKIRAFNCVNFEARMNDPVPPPEFVEAETVANGEYWAIPYVNNSFLVFPNVKNYSDNHHTARAMGVVFKSNFKSGYMYSRITVDKAAIFECTGNVWILSQTGILRLG